MKQLVTFSLAILLCSCQTVKLNMASDRAEENIEEQLSAVKQINSRGFQLPPNISAALKPPIQSAGIRAVPVELQRFDVKASQVDIRQLYMGLFANTSFNLILRKGVKARVTVDLKEVTLFETMDVLKELYGYHYKKVGKQVIVYDREMRTQIFPVNYLNFKRVGKTSVVVDSSSLSSQQKNVDLKTESEQDFWKSLSEVMSTLVGDKDGRKVIVQSQTGMLVVHAYPNELRLVAEYLGQAHQNLNRQVVLEAKIIEVELSEHFQAGINWTQLLTQASNSVRASQISGTALPSIDGVSSIGGQSADLAVSDIANSTASAFGGFFSVAMRVGSFAAFAELLQNQGQVRVLSSPRVSTVNNQKAVIKVGGDEYFVTDVSNNPVTDNTGKQTNVPSVSLKPFFSGVALDVTPQIDDGNNVILHIHPTISQVAQRSKSFVVYDSNFSVPLAYSSIQESDNVVRARSGQFVLIGGLMRDNTTEEDSRIPVLGDLPLIGNLFKHKKINTKKTELIILLKPTVVGTDSLQWQRQIEASTFNGAGRAALVEK